MAYHKYTKEQKQEFEDLLLRIKSDVSIIEYAQILGFTPVKVGKKYTLKEHNSVIIDPEENFFWRNAYKGDPHWCGSIIDFVCHFEYKKEDEAIRSLAALVRDSRAMQPTEQSMPETKKKKEKAPPQFSLPKPAKDNRAVYAYLTKTRCIDPAIVMEYMQEVYIYQDERRNCVFVGFDEGGKPCFACKRGSTPGVRFFMDVPRNDYTRCITIDNGCSTVAVTESPIDGYSLMSLIKRAGRDPHTYNYLFLGGTNKYEALLSYLQRYPNTTTVILGLDNDTPGIKAAQHIKELLTQSGYKGTIRERYPTEKDWNADLQAAVTASKEKATVRGLDPVKTERKYDLEK